MPAERCPVRIGEVRLRPPVLRTARRRSTSTSARPWRPWAGRCCPWPRHFKSWQIENGAPGGDDPRRALVSRQLCSAGPSGSTVNTSSMGTPNTLAMFQASTREGLYRPFPGFRWSPAGPPPALPAPPASGPDGPGAPSSGCGSRLQPPALPEAVPGGGQGVDHHRGGQPTVRR